MRFIILAALPLLTACGVDNDPANDKVTVTYDRDKIEKAGRTAKDVAVSAGNVADSTVKAVKKEVGDIDVDVKVKRTKNGEKPAR